MRETNFALNIREWAEKAEGAIDETIRAIVIEIGSSVIRMSPVDTGRFRGNWQFNLDAPALGQLETTDKDGAETISRLVAEANSFTAGQVAYIVNNLPYAVELEYGHSQKAPQGMVRVTVARFQQIVREAARLNQV
ncbi:HK97 gp10 family phage protein [Pseudomonas sp. LTJR-52]|uniref:HK97 gp10 family phage protein n=1 Tax=Pseudomonas sp. LTJR-52 TaxID=2479392 RepID=UPI000EFB2E92|nr:HK97 gp10 family phage protein [Pseudomonas sp. LTJR-52]AYN94429.1 HK97 gp10 family phage protein [Pseudomonas sp. LTJR-52]